MKPTSSGNRTIRRSSTLTKAVVKSVGAARCSRTGKTTSWVNILDTCRARLLFSPRDLSFAEVSVQDMSPAFLKAFGIERPDRCPLASLFGKATSREFLGKVELAMLNGLTVMEFVNLYRTDGAVLSCHVVVRSSPSGATAQSQMMRQNHSDERYATLTVRSASSLGNANYVGIGLLGVDRISRAQLERVIGRDDFVESETLRSPKLPKSPASSDIYTVDGGNTGDGGRYFDFGFVAQWQRQHS